MEKTENSNLAEIIGLLQVKLDAANSQILHLGLLVEFLYQELDATDLELNLDKYPEWAQNRFEEIKNIATEETGEKMRAEMQKEMEEIAKNIQL